MVNLTGATRLQLQSPFAIYREGRRPFFLLAMVSSFLGRVQAQFTSFL